MHDHFTFHTVRSFVHTVKIVNDVAKRGIKLAADYAMILTNVKIAWVKFDSSSQRAQERELQFYEVKPPNF